MYEVITKKVDGIVSVLLDIGSEDFAFQKGLSKEGIEESERELGVVYPTDFRYFLSKMNGVLLYGELILPALVTEENLIEESIPQVKKWEQFETANPMPKYLLPFSPNGRGDHYCFDLRKKNEWGVCPVIFWQWDYNYRPQEDVEQVNEDFVAWVKEVIEDLADV